MIWQAAQAHFEGIMGAGIGAVAAEHGEILNDYTRAFAASMVSDLSFYEGMELEGHLYEPLGMESDGYWLLDTTGREMAFGGVNLTARDFAKLGELYRRGGEWNGRQVVPADWVAASVVPDAPHLEWGRPVIAGEALSDGYGYQWWLIPGGLGQYSAIGVYNQWVFVSPQHGVTIVKLSATRTYGTTMGEETSYSETHEAFLRAVVAHVDAA